jgi:hypothetical protein
MTLDGVKVSGNAASSNQPTGVAAVVFAGGIYNKGTLHLIRTTVSGNTATATGDAASVQVFGAGISNESNAVLTLNRTTVSGNTGTGTGTGASSVSIAGGGIRTTSGGTSTVAIGGGIYNNTGPGGSVTVTSSTLTANSISALTFVQGSNFQTDVNDIFKNTIVSAGVGSTNCGAGLVSSSLGHNLEGTTNSCGFGGPADQPSTAVTGLDPTLASNGGATQTHALLPGSPAIDAGIASTGETTDQRDLARPSDFLTVPNLFASDGSDIGAFEAQAPPPVPVTPTPTPPAFNLKAAIKKCKKKKSKKARKKCIRRAKQRAGA